MALRRFLVLALALTAALPATAQASRTDTAAQIADARWGVPCGGTPVTISRGDLPPGTLARAYFNWEGSEEAAAGYTSCRIIFRRGPIPWEDFCTIMVHERGHLAGYRPAAGSAYVREDGTVDKYHSSKRGSVMFPRHGKTWKACKRPRPRVASSAPTVILLPGGGWQNADPQTMEPWARDFRAHGIRVRTITYPLRDILGAIRAVRAEVEKEEGVVILYGISAGGLLASALAASGEVAGAVNVVGPTDLTRWAGPAGAHIMKQIGISEADKRQASPFFRLRAGTTPQLVQCGAADPLVFCHDQAVPYVKEAKRFQRDTGLQIMVNAHAQSFVDRDVARRWIQKRWPS